MHVDRYGLQMQKAVCLQAGEYVFKEINNFKYLGTNLSSINDNREEIKKRITSGNTFFYAFSKLLFKEIKRTAIQLSIDQ